MFFGSITVIFFTVCILISVKLFSLYGQMTNFVLYGILPKVKARETHNKRVVAIWIICAVNWALYTAINVHFTNTE